VDGVCAFAGYGDLSVEWYYQPSQFFRQYKNVDTIRKKLGDKNNFKTIDERIDLYVYLRQYGFWPEFVLGQENPNIRTQRYSPLLHLDARYPPTVLIVPYKLIFLRDRDHDLFSHLEDDEVVEAWHTALDFVSICKTRCHDAGAGASHGPQGHRHFRSGNGSLVRP